MAYVKPTLETETKKKAFYRHFLVRIPEELRNDAVVDALRAKEVLSPEEAEDHIGNLSTRASRRALWDIMQRKHYSSIPLLIQIMSDNSEPGQESLVNDMKQYLQETDPELAKELTATDELKSTLNTAGSTPTDYKFKVTPRMVFKITSAITESDQALEAWSEAEMYADFTTVAADKWRVRQFLKSHDIRGAVEFGISAWATRTCGTFEDILCILEKWKLEEVVKSLKEKAESIKNMG